MKFHLNNRTFDISSSMINNIKTSCEIILKNEGGCSSVICSYCLGSIIPSFCYLQDFNYRIDACEKFINQFNKLNEDTLTVHIHNHVYRVPANKINEFRDSCNKIIKNEGDCESEDPCYVSCDDCPFNEDFSHKDCEILMPEMEMFKVACNQFLEQTNISNEHKDVYLCNECVLKQKCNISKILSLNTKIPIWGKCNRFIREYKCKLK